ncbi:MAG TPA: extracellular solute-binding protein [Candidatus Angelobacter sp.]|jgi:molybdate/tungstate transport system substrate-binding protein
MSRRRLLAYAATFGAGAALGLRSSSALADALAPLDVAYAGSMGSLMEGQLKTAAAQDLKLDLHGRAQGSNALAQLIVGGSIRPDVFISITPSPMLTVLHAAKADTAVPVARTEMVIAYSPKSKFAEKFALAAEGKSNWWQILQEPGLRFGRTDPATDPQGRNIIFTLMLAEKLLKQPGLAMKILGSTINPQQIFTEPTVQARLQSGELDAASAYKIQPGPFTLPFITLQPEINLSGERIHTDHPEITLTLNGKTYQPEPLIFYAAALKDAPNKNAAAAFVEWLAGMEAQAIFRRYNYGPPGGASGLHA